jgi:cyclopropane fatty-acyl-phospholipid synthase-like methyltransferase
MPCVKNKGKANATSPSDITKLFNFLRIKENSTFCDLGCGNAKLCIKSITRVKKAVGFECDAKRYQTAKKRAKKFSNIRIYKGSYETKNSLNKIRQVDVFFCVNEIDYKFLKKLGNVVKKRTYFIQYYLPSCPVKPQYKHGWYYIMKTPFRTAKTKNEWITSLQNGDLINLKKKIRSYFKKDYKERIQDLEEELKANF